MRLGNSTNADDFDYVEFSGKGGRTCPTCQGTGRIAKRMFNILKILGITLFSDLATDFSLKINLKNISYI